MRPWTVFLLLGACGSSSKVVRPAPMETYVQRFNTESECGGASRGRLPLGLNLVDSDKEQVGKYDVIASTCSGYGTEGIEFLGWDADKSTICFAISGASEDLSTQPSVEEMQAEMDAGPAWVLAAPSIQELRGSVRTPPAGAVTKWVVEDGRFDISTKKDVVDKFKTDSGSTVTVTEETKRYAWSISFCASGFTLKNEDKHVLFVRPYLNFDRMLERDDEGAGRVVAAARGGPIRYVINSDFHVHEVESAVGHEAVQMHVQAEVAAESLDHREHPRVQPLHRAEPVALLARRPRAARGRVSTMGAVVRGADGGAPGLRRGAAGEGRRGPRAGGDAGHAPRASRSIPA